MFFFIVCFVGILDSLIFVKGNPIINKLSMKRRKIILSLVTSISILILVVGILAVRQFMQWGMIINSGAFSAAHKDIMEELLGHAFIWCIILLVCSLSVILFLYWLLLPDRKGSDICEVADNLSVKDEFCLLRIDSVNNFIMYGEVKVKCRPQITKIIVHLMGADKHAMSYEELNDILGQGFYDGSYSSQKKANNLKYELKRLLEGMPFVVCPATPNEIKLLGKAVG